MNYPRQYSHTLPGYVRHWCGTWKVELWRVGKQSWMLVGGNRTALVVARTGPAAQDIIRDLVSRAAPVTDKRRKYWIYT